MSFWWNQVCYYSRGIMIYYVYLLRDNFKYLFSPTTNCLNYQYLLYYLCWAYPNYLLLELMQRRRYCYFSKHVINIHTQTYRIYSQTFLTLSSYDVNDLLQGKFSGWRHFIVTAKGNQWSCQWVGPGITDSASDWCRST